jgi:hypothetical protein
MAIFGNVGLPTLLATVTSEMKVGEANMNISRMQRRWDKAQPLADVKRPLVV